MSHALKRLSSYIVLIMSEVQLINLDKNTANSLCWNYLDFKGYLLSSLQYTPVMEFNKLVTLGIFCLCLVGESWTEKPSSPTPDSQVVENGVSGE